MTADLTLEQKAALLTGADRWQTVPLPDGRRVWVSDGPHGLRRETAPDVSLPATAFPTLSSLGATWDTGLVREVAAAMARECLAEGVHVLLGPGVNIKRTPLCGRNFEYVAEDPVLAGEIGVAYVEGLQGAGVGASLKHFAANNQETRRHSVSAEVDERTLREIYLPAFERVVTRARPWTVMCAYNRLNGTYASEHEWLLTTVLRDEWGYDGLVVSDWGAVYDRVLALRAGLDLQMPADDGEGAAALVAAVAAGELDEAVLDRSVARVVSLVDRAAPHGPPLTPDEVSAHEALARRAAAAGTVLLRNDGVLPLDPATTGRVAVVGRFAAEPHIQGGGSAAVNARRVTDAVTALRAALPTAEVGYEPGYAFGTTTDGDTLSAAAVASVVGAAVALVFVGTPPGVESEGYDRTGVDLPQAQRALLDEVVATGVPTVVVITAGSAVLLDDSWHARAAAVVLPGFAGQASGDAIADVLTGAAEPGGRLTETWPLRLGDVPGQVTYPGERHQVRYGEGVFVGYRGYDALDTAVRYPFGHGGSYAAFEWSPVEVEVTDADGGEVLVRVRVTNTAPRPGREVVQVYVGDHHSSVRRPPRELRGFVTLDLGPGETAGAELRLAGRDFSYWDVVGRCWRREAGEFRIEVAASSRDVRSAATVTLPAWPAAPVFVDDDELERRLQRR